MKKSVLCQNFVVFFYCKKRLFISRHIISLSRNNIFLSLFSQFLKSLSQEVSQFPLDNIDKRVFPKSKCNLEMVSYSLSKIPFSPFAVVKWNKTNWYKADRRDQLKSGKSKVRNASKVKTQLIPLPQGLVTTFHMRTIISPGPSPLQKSNVTP